MECPITDDNYDTMDRKTVRSICESVGERLRQSLRPDVSMPSRQLQILLEELHRRDGEQRRGASN
jgi:hypothetical protein